MLVRAGLEEKLDILQIFIPFPKNMCTMVQQFSLYQCHTTSWPLTRAMDPGSFLSRVGIVIRSSELEIKASGEGAQKGEI